MELLFFEQFLISLHPSEIKISISKKHNKETRSNYAKFKNSFRINRAGEILESFAKLGCGWVYLRKPN